LKRKPLEYFITIFLTFLLGCSSFPYVEPQVEVQQKSSKQQTMYVTTTQNSFYRGQKVTLFEVVDGIAITSEGEIPFKYLEKERSYFRLTVHTPHKNARIRILNIKPKYHDGIWLKKGRYHIEVTLKGYIPYKKWINIAQDSDLMIRLKRGANLSMGFITWQKIEGVKYIDGLFWQDQAINKREKMTWHDAQGYCKRLKIKITQSITLDDFTLPTDKELLALNKKRSQLDYTGSIYWSASTDKRHSKFAKYVYINSKKTGWYNKSGSTYVRCVSRKNYPLQLPLNQLTKYLIDKYNYSYLEAYELALNVKYGKPIVRNIKKLKNKKIEFQLRSQKYNTDKKYFYNKLQRVEKEKYMISNPNKIRFEIINEKAIFKNIF